MIVCVNAFMTRSAHRNQHRVVVSIEHSRTIVAMVNLCGLVWAASADVIGGFQHTAANALPQGRVEVVLVARHFGCEGDKEGVWVFRRERHPPTKPRHTKANFIWSAGSCAQMHRQFANAWLWVGRNWRKHYAACFSTNSAVHLMRPSTSLAEN